MDAFKVVVDHEDMIVTLQAGIKLPGTISTARQLNVILEENNVFKGVDSAEIERAFQELPSLTTEKVYVIARGEPPQNGKNGRLEFHVNVSGKPVYNLEADPRDSGRIDYKSAVSVESVVVGTHLLTIIPPTLGKDGYNLSGKVLNAKNGKEVSIVLSEGTEFNSDRTKVYATSHGRPIFSHGFLSVRSVYDVPGDVCYETGNIYFDGHVKIMGSVQDEFSVEANSIEIKGIVGSADIKAKKDLVILGGVNGRGKANIVCGADANIKYINAATVEVKGNLVVNKEIVNATIRCNGKVSSKKIIGGEVMALKGLDAVQIGSDVGTPTFIRPGINYELERIENAIKVLSKQIDAVIKPVKNNLGERDFFCKLSAEKQAELLKAYTYFKRIKKGYLQLLKGKNRIQNDEAYDPVKEVIIYGRLFHDVQVRTNYCSKRFIKGLTGPIKLIEDINSASMKDVPLSQNDLGEEKPSATAAK